MAWFDILEAVRELPEREPITAATVARVTGLDPAAASAWLGKFTNWGYLYRVEDQEQQRGRGRPQTVYALTEYGKTRKKPKMKLPPHPDQVKRRNIR